MPFVITPNQNSSDKQKKKMTLNSRLEQILDYIRLLVQCNNHLEVKNRALMKMEHCFPYPHYNHRLFPRLPYLDNRTTYKTQYEVPNLLIQTPHRMKLLLQIKAKWPISRLKSERIINEMILTVHSENSKEKNTKNGTI